MIVLFTDYGIESPYVGQMKTVLHQALGPVTIIDLCHNVSAHNIRAAAYLLALWVNDFDKGTVFVCVVDPHVGDPKQRAAMIEADGRWFIGPDNGLFNVIIKRAQTVRWWDIAWRPSDQSATFHGRDLYAPMAAKIMKKEAIPQRLEQNVEKRLRPFWEEQLNQVIYLDTFGNAMTGLVADIANQDKVLVIDKLGERLKFARTFYEAAEGCAFWYKNAYGMVEIAVNQGRAADVLKLEAGDVVSLHQE